MDKDERKRRKDEAYRLYMESMKNKPAGVYCVKNKVNNKIFVDAHANVTNKIERLKVELAGQPSGFVNQELQKDYKTLGGENFEFSILEVINQSEIEDQKELKQKVDELKTKWLDKLAPYGDKGYNIKRNKKEKIDIKAKIAEKREELAEAVEVTNHAKVPMNTLSDLFWNASVEELKKGYVKKEGQYICLVCGAYFDEDVIYPMGQVFFNAKKTVMNHIQEEHKGMFDVLLDMDKKYTGLSQVQSDLLKDFYVGMGDDVVAKNAGITKSTVRNHRFRLKEKQKQAKIFLALMSLVDEQQDEESAIINVHRTPRAMDERYAITKEHQQATYEKYMVEGKVSTFPSKEKDKIVILLYIASRFEYGVKYKEGQVNQVLKKICEDFVTIRRYMIQYGFMKRSKDGSEYWLV